MKFFPAGDAAMVVELGNEINEDINNKVRELSERIENAHIKGIVELLPTYCSLMIFYDPSLNNYRKISREIDKYKIREKSKKERKKKILEVPCCYEGEFAADLDDMEKETGLPKEEIIRLHSERDYRIYMMGFLPGFVYLGGLNEKIAVPRLSEPRVRIPARSVGIGGKQTGIYPIDSPGGWRLIGSTPLNMYDLKRENPVLCEMGEYLHFININKKEYDLIRSDVEKGSYNLRFL